MDHTLLQFINQRCANPLTDHLALLASTAGLFILPLWALVLWWKRQRHGAFALVFSQALALALTLGAQLLFARPRPLDTRLLLPLPDTFSFPSGHAALVFAGALVVLLLKPSWRRGSLLGALACGVAWSRVALGHHYPMDVLGGAVLGLGVGAVSWGWLAGGARGTLEKLRWLLWLQVSAVILITQAAYLGTLPLRYLSWPNADKVLHFTLFGMVVFWMTLWLRDARWQVGPLRIPRAVVWTLLPAMLEEGLQVFSTRRTADVKDLACDVAGMTVCWLLGAWLLRRGQGGGAEETATASLEAA